MNTTASAPAATPNIQLPGTLVLLENGGINPSQAAEEKLAKVWLSNPATRRRDPAYVRSAALMVAAYNMVDRAARELGVDAVELATGLDLAEALRYSADYANLPSVNVGRPDQVAAAQRLLRPHLPALIPAVRAGE